MNLCSCVILAGFALSDQFATKYPNATVRTPLGAVEGEDHGAFRVFRGVRYAEPASRFEEAVLVRPWNGTVHAKRFGDACEAASSWTGLFKASEDCLFLNVWAPAAEQAGKSVPVFVFIHGGGFMQGSAAEPYYWGDEVVTKAALPVVYVTISYRLSIFGFYSGDGQKGNLGLRDQQLALRWVRMNIAAFGGDPEQVTLAGQSAGAMSVQAHLVAPSSWGLFSRAIMGSTVGLHWRSLEENDEIVNSVARSLACTVTNGKRTPCLQSRPAGLLSTAAKAITFAEHLLSPCEGGCVNILPWVPTVDGDFIPAPPLELLRAGRHAKVPLLLLNVRNETMAFTPEALQAIAKLAPSYEAAMHVLFNKNANAVMEHYAKTSDSASMSRASQLNVALTDLLFTCYSRVIGRLWQDTSPVYLSTFMHAPSATADPKDGQVDTACEHGATCHCTLVTWMFPESPDMRQWTKLEYSSAEIDLAGRFSTAVLQFAYGQTAPWIPYDPTKDASLQWDDDARTVLDYHRDHCEFLESLGLPWHLRLPETDLLV